MFIMLVVSVVYAVSWTKDLYETIFIKLRKVLKR